MSAMLAAIKKKRMGQPQLSGDHQDMGHASVHADDKEKDLHGFVASLTEEDKGKLKGILDSDKTQGIAKGDASTEEQGEIESEMHKENAMNSMQQNTDDARHPQVESSDDIAKSMVDHKAMSAMENNDKPRNMGERARMYAAQKLKQKGKI